MHLPGGGRDDDVYVIVNGDLAAHAFELPALDGGRRWYRVVDTMRNPPSDIVEPGSEVKLSKPTYQTGPRAVVVLVGR